MRLFGRNIYRNGEIDLQAFGLRRAWDELQADWRYAASGVPWARDGAQGLGSDRDNVGPLGLFMDVTRFQYYEWDIAPLVQEWVNGRANQGVLIMGSGTHEFSRLGLYSSNYSETELRPVLYVIYTVPTPTATPTPSPTATQVTQRKLLLPLIVR